MSKHVWEKCGKRADGESHGRTDGESYGRTDGESDGRTETRTDGHHHTIIRPVWRRAYKKWKILAHRGTRTHDSWITKLLPKPPGYQIWYTFNELKLTSRLQVFLLLFIATSYQSAECFHFVVTVFNIVIIYSQCIIIWASFCCSTNRYWSNSNMTSIL